MREFVRVISELKELRVNGKKVIKRCIYPTYLASGKDIMKKGGKFYAILNKETNMWTQDESEVISIIDSRMNEYVKDHYRIIDNKYYDYDDQPHEIRIEYLDVSSTGRLKEFNLWFMNLPTNHNYRQLDSEITFKNDAVTPDMYRSKRLDYDIVNQDTSAYDKLMPVLYSDEERQKIEWLIGSIFAGESKNIQKFLVLYGDPGTGKSTVLDLIKDLTSGYWVPFVASDLADKSKQFSTATFKDNPLVAIQDDGSLLKIDSPVINEIVSHTDVIINEKGKQQYSIKSNTIMFLATNDTVDIHDTKLGITRRLLDVYPSGEKLPIEEYDDLKAKLKFEIPGIAYKCLKVYQKLGKNYYSSYVPFKMIRKTNYIHNFLFDSLNELQDNNKSPFYSRDKLYLKFKQYCEDSGLGYPPKRIAFGEQIKEYFEISYDSKWTGKKTERNIYEGLKVWKILGISKEEYEGGSNTENIKKEQEDNWFIFSEHETCTFDEMFKDCPAQYATTEGSPIKKWKNVTTKLSDIDTHKLHWLKLPNYIIKIDFDKKDKDGNKSLEANIEAASKFPKTYAEVSKSGSGIHLYYIYSGGDPGELSNIYDKDIEIKKSVGDMSHRRLLTKWNNLPISTISTGLPFKKGGTKVVDEKIAITEKGLRTTIKRSLAKEVHPDTRSNIDWIYKILNDAYESGLVYDVSDMRQDVLIFAMNSTHQSEYCVNKVGEMKFASEEAGEYVDEGYDDKDPIIFFDFEVFPNLNLLCWKYDNPEDKTVQAVFNPSPEYIAGFFGFNQEKKNKVIGFNNKEYDNHIAYDIYLGKTPYEVYCTSQGIINKEKDAKHREAKHLSYSDLYDFLPNKMGLKKWEIKLGIDHQEFSHRWDEPIPENLWPELAEYCKNDVLATEAVFHSKDGQAAWKGRRILCDLANILMGPGSTVNDSTNDLTTKLIVGNEKNPQRDFVYPDLSEEFPGYEFSNYGIDIDRYISKDVKISGKSFYKGYDPGEGGFVWAKPGMYGRAVCFDVASMHPSSIIAENGFGPYTENFKRLLDLRLHIKHKDYDAVRSMYNGALAKYLESDEDAKALSFALKIAINSVYGLTAAKFSNRLRDSRNVDNWVAKRGALFMIDLMLKVQEIGGTVIHCKTDSIKVVNPSEEIANYIISRGKEFGYNFEIEHIFDRICLVNDAVYVCKYTNDPENEDMAGKWDATGKQYQVPYVFKTIFSHEPIAFDDLCETKSTSSALYLDFNEGLSEGEHNYQFIGKTGRFTPVVDGSGGGELYRDAGNDKFARVEGTSRPKEKGKKVSGYRWYESVTIKDNEELKQKIDYSYYNVLVDKAIDNISKFGDVEIFTSDEPMPIEEPVPDFMQIPDTDAEELPFL